MTTRWAFVVAVAIAGAPSIASGAWETRSVAGMNTHVYTPGETGTGRGLFVGLHGCVQTAAALRDHADLAAAADEHGFVVALPDVPAGGVIAGCWDYYGPDHDRSSRHADDLLALTLELRADPDLSIDEDRVVLAGLSSGAGEAAVLGCLAPDVFAAVGIAAGPAVGTTESQAAFVTTTAMQAEATCRALAAEHESAFARQRVAIVHGTMDYTVARAYADLNATMYASLLCATEEATLDLGTLPGVDPQGDGTVWRDEGGDRVMRIIVDGMGHAWPAGTGEGLEVSFVSPRGPSFGAVLMQWMDATGGGDDGDPDSGGDGSEGSGGGDDDGEDGGSGSSANGDDDGGSGHGDVGVDADGAGCSCRGGGRGEIFALLLGLGLATRRRARATGTGTGTGSGTGTGTGTEPRLRRLRRLSLG